jgi:hypothetical protein
MSSYSHIRAAAEQQAQPQEITSDSNQLNAKEIAVLLDMIKRSTFLGENVEAVYNMILKLQNQYTNQNK